MLTPMKLALLQMSAAETETPRIDRITNAMLDAAQQGAALVIAPELALTSYGAGDALTDLAQPADGPWIATLRQAAHDIGITLIAGFPERDGAARYISAITVFADGRPPAIYRKAFLYGAYEKNLFTANGRTADLIELNGLKIGTLICFDVEFPECVRALARKGADLIAVPTALAQMPGSQFVAQKVIPVRAFENQVFVAYCNHADTDASYTYQGLSSIAAPDGTILAAAPETGEILIFAEIDPDDYAASRQINTYLAELDSAGGKA